MDMSHNDKYARTLVMFLAEGLRTRTFTANRAAEIAEKVLANINLVDTEEHFLLLVKELSHDFEELGPFGDSLEKDLATSSTRGLEESIRQYAVQALHSDPKEAMEILKAAAEPGLSKASIYEAFPKFKQHHEQPSAS